MTPFDAEHSSSFDRAPSLPESTRLLGRAVATLFFTPDHHHLYRDIKQEALAAQEVIPLQPPVEQLQQELLLQLPPRLDEPHRIITTPEIIATSGLLMQFGNHFKVIPQWLQVDYASVHTLYQTVTHEADTGRLSLADQLILAADQQHGNIEETLKLLLITSRHYARWLDEKTISNLPETTPPEQKALMTAWQDTLLGIKSDDTTYHDAAGDTYYAWTHAYADYLYDRLVDRSTLATRLAGVAFRNGTTIMQTLVNNLNPRGILSDHAIAARYGNAIADTCIQLTAPRL